MPQEGSLVPVSRLAVRCRSSRGTVMEDVCGLESRGGGAGSCRRPPPPSSCRNATLPRADGGSLWGRLEGGSMAACDDYYRFQVTSAGAREGGRASADPNVAAASEIASRDALSRLLEGSGGGGGGFGVALWLSLPPPAAPFRASDDGNGGNGNSTRRFLADEGDAWKEAPILTLGRVVANRDDRPTMPAWRECGELYDLDVSYQPQYGELILRYADRDGGGAADGGGAPAQIECRTLRFRSEEILAGSPAAKSSGGGDDSASVHLAVLFAPQGLSVFGQGRALAEVPLPALANPSSAASALPPPVSHWDADADRLVLLRGGLFEGGLHQADFFVMSDRIDPDGMERQVRSLYEQGFARPALCGAGYGNDDDALVQFDPLRAKPGEARRIPQDSASPLALELGGMVRWRRNVTAVVPAPDPASPPSSAAEFALQVNVTRLPAHGVVRVVESSRAVRQGDSLVLPLSIQQVAVATLPLEYELSDPMYYNLPPPGTGEERLEATLSVVWQGAVLASEPVAVDIQVQPVNRQPPVLAAPARLLASNSTELALSNVTLTDPDPGSASTPVRVDVSSQHSPLSLVLEDRASFNGILNASALSYMYDDCRRRSDSAWQCTGVEGPSFAGSAQGWGGAARTIVFVAPMSQVPAVLGAFLTARLDRGDDVLTLRVHDGRDGAGCLSAREHALYGSNWTLHRGCFVAEATVELALDPSVPRAGALGEAGRAGSSNVSRLADLLFWGVVIALALGLGAWLRRCLPRCLARGAAAVDADGEGDGSTDVEAGYQTQSDSSGSVGADAIKVQDSPTGALDTTALDDDLDTTASF